MQNSAWTSKQKELMAKLLDECEAESRHYVESKKFRKRNYSDVDEIDVLVRRGVIQDRNLQYSVSVLCLHQIESDLASKICHDADSLWRTYREEYLRDDDDTVFLSAVIKAAGLSMKDAQLALHYLMQTHWHRGHSTMGNQLYSSVEVGEEVLKYKSFSEYLAHLQHQYSALPRGSDSFDVAKYLHEANSSPAVARAAGAADLPAWVNVLSPGVRELLGETLQAKESGWNRLTAMGIRAVFDMFSAEALAGDAGVFQKKLNDMLREEHIAPTQQENLGAVIEAGHAAAHRGFNPTPEEVETMWRVLLNALESFYVLKPKASRLRSDTPARTPRPKA